MAIIPCPECGKEVSDKAEICPHCGIKAKAQSSSAGNLLSLMFTICFGMGIAWFLGARDIPVIFVGALIGTCMAKILFSKK